MSRYVIIGGSGFLGKTLINTLLSSGADNIVSLDLNEIRIPLVKYVFCDISKPLDFEFLPDDIVIHLAARQYHLSVPRKNILKFFTEVNVDGTKNVLERMKHCSACNMIYFSTDMVYGVPKFVPVTTSHEQNPVGEYGLSKKIAEEICKEYRNLGFNITIFRPRMIIGKGRLGILVKLFKLIKHNLPVPMIGAGNNCYQMVSVNDCASAIIKAVEKGIPNKEFNLGSKNPPKVRDLLKSLIKKHSSMSILFPTWGKSVKLILKIFSTFGIRIMYKEQYTIADLNYLLSISDTEKNLDWHPQFNDEDMLTEAFENYLRTK